MSVRNDIDAETADEEYFDLTTIPDYEDAPYKTLDGVPRIKQYTKLQNSNNEQ